MKAAQERLKFIVKLAQERLSALRPGDLLNLRDDFVSFFYAEKGQDIRGPIGEVVTPFEQPLPQNYSIEDFEALQKEVYAILSEIVTGRDRGTPSAPECEIKAKLMAFSFHGIKNRSMLMLRGSTRDMFLLRLYLLLSQEPVNRILRCKAPDCDRIFYRERKQEFCSTKCTNRAYMKEYRKDPTFAASAAEESHDRYKKKVQKDQPGKTVKRRPRKKA